jgi:hypothetical protein
VTDDEGALHAELEAIEKEWGSRVLRESDLAYSHVMRAHAIALMLGESHRACVYLCILARASLPPASYPQENLHMSRALKLVRIATREFPVDESAWYTAANVLETIAQRLASRDTLIRAEIIARAPQARIGSTHASTSTRGTRACL